MYQGTLVEIYNSTTHRHIATFYSKERLPEYLKSHGYEMVKQGPQTCQDDAIWVDVRKKVNVLERELSNEF